LYAKPEEE